MRWSIIVGLTAVACGGGKSDSTTSDTTGSTDVSTSTDTPTSTDSTPGPTDSTPAPTDSTPPDDTATELSPADRLAGVYDVQEVTCSGAVIPIDVTATVTFEGTTYLEEWTFPKGACEVRLDGTLSATEEQLTLEDVAVSCTKACATSGFCDPTPCPVDQVYDYTLDGDELLMSFTQVGAEHACGPCGDGTPTTYLLVR